MQMVSRSFLFTWFFSVALALFVAYMFLKHRGIKADQRRLYLFGLSIVWAAFLQIMVF